MSFKSEAVIDLKDLILDKIFNYNEYSSHISDIDMYSGYLRLDHICDYNNIDDDVAYYAEQYPLWTQETLRELIQDNIGDFSPEKWKDMKKEMGNMISTILLPTGTSEALLKYGIKLVKTEYTTPREYNFRSDSIDLILEDLEDSSEIHKELIPLMQNFIDKAPKSCDGYISLLPEMVEECTRLDIPHIFAILYKEGILEDVIDNVEDYISAVTELVRDEGSNALQTFLAEEYKKQT